MHEVNSQARRGHHLFGVICLPDAGHDREGDRLRLTLSTTYTPHLTPLPSSYPAASLGSSRRRDALPAHRTENDPLVMVLLVFLLFRRRQGG